MEKHFATTSDLLPEKQSSSSKRSRFSDSTLPSASRNTSAIRQTSTGDATGPGGFWDQPLMTAQTESAPLDWGAGLPGFAPPSGGASMFSGKTPPTAYGRSNAFQAGPGFETSNADSNPIAYSNTESQYNASPSTHPSANSGMMFPPNGTTSSYALPWGYGLGYYDPSTGRLYANPQGIDPRGFQAQAPQQAYGPNPYGMGGGGAFGATGAFGGVHPYFAGTPYGAFAGGMGMSDGMQNPMTLQAWYQQELLRHQRSLEKEEEKDAKTAEAEEAARSEWSSKRLLPVKVSSPLAETLWSGVKTMSVFNTPTGPDRGVGRPLANRSWLDRPYYGGLFVGTMRGSELVSGMIDQKSGGNGGLLLGYNFNEYWGLEGRFHVASPDIRETARGRQAYEDLYREINELPADANVPPLTTRSHDLTILDFSVHYYPLGNAKWRPFFKYGLGISRGSFVDTYGVKRTAESMAMPIGFGLRYWWNERIAIQADIVDNIIFSEGITKTQNNWTFAIGISYAFGTGKKRRPVPYWPYTPSTGSKF